MSWYVYRVGQKNKKKETHHILLGILYYISICEKLHLLLLNRLNHYSYILKSVCTLILTHRIRRILKTAPCRACSTLPNLYRLIRRVLSFPSHGLSLIWQNNQYMGATGGLYDCWWPGLVNKSLVPKCGWRSVTLKWLQELHWQM